MIMSLAQLRIPALEEKEHIDICPRKTETSSDSRDFVMLFRGEKMRKKQGKVGCGPGGNGCEEGSKN